MANKTVDDFSAVTVPATTDTLLVTQSSIAKKETLAQVDTLLSATTKTLTNKTITSPVINTAVSGTAIDTDGTLATNSDTLLASQKAIKTYTDLRMLKTGSNLAIGSDADGDMYYRASSVLARLAKGAANLKMFMNAGATAPEWAAGISAISFTRDMSAATGNVAYTGAGFKPAAVIVIATIDGQTDTFSVGWQVGTTKGSINVNPVDNKYAITTNFCCYITTGEASHAQSAVVATYDADGVTITWTRYSDPIVTISGCLFFLR